MEEHFATIDKFHDKVKIIVILESELKFHDEGVVELFKNLPFNFDSSDLISLND